MTSNLKRYVGRVLMPGGRLSAEYVDWFEDDVQARLGYQTIMEEQGFKVKAVTIANQTAIVELCVC